MKKLLGIFLAAIIFIPFVSAKDLRFAQVTDVKYVKTDNNGTLAKVIEDINKQKDIDFVVFTGDNIGKPSKENLDSFLSEAKKLKRPFYLVLGDKDVNKQKDLGKKEYAKYVHKKIRGYKPKTANFVFEKKGVVFIVADGAKEVIPSTTGYYKDNVLEWVDANLDLHSTKPAIILQHFPLIPPANKETYYTYKADKYLDILSKHKNVKAVISGHFGVNNEVTKDGIVHISTAPVPNYRIIDLLDYDSDSFTIWAEVRSAE